MGDINREESLKIYKMALHYTTSTNCCSNQNVNYLLCVNFL